MSEMPKIRGIPRPQEMKIVVNEDKPQTTALLLEFEPDLSFTKEGWWPSQILVDDSKNIYVAQDNESTIFKFDSFGNEVSAKKFSKGQGPGVSFSLSYLFFSEDRSSFFV
jgi:DNA-binding beta-propeller fold protein YncE